MPDPHRAIAATGTPTSSLSGSWNGVAGGTAAGGGPRQGFGNLDQLSAFLLRLQDEDGLCRRADASQKYRQTSATARGDSAA
jgi:hypothetical protein